MSFLDVVSNSISLERNEGERCTRFLEELLSDYPSHNLQVRLWDGSIWGANDPKCTLTLNRPGTLRRLCTDPSELKLGEAYVYGDVDISGDIEAILDFADYLIKPRDCSLGARTRLLHLFHSLPQHGDAPGRWSHRTASLDGELHSRERDRQAVRYHYDLPPEFFALWLDSGMEYSSAYFESREQEDLDAAQFKKLDYICRKLELSQGESLLDIGCGWGQLVVHAAAHYGVRSVGITLSVPQAETARQRIREAGVSERCRVEVCDYRDFEGKHRFDKIVSVGMFEHVGARMLPEFFHAAWQWLKPGGLFLNSGISANANDQRVGPSFVDQYVFPDGELVPISTNLGIAERAGFEVRDVENLREHYALTLRHWVRRLERNEEEVKNLTDEATYRIWRLYMAGSAHRFSSGRLNLFHTLLRKPGENGNVSLTREHWYQH